MPTARHPRIAGPGAYAERRGALFASLALTARVAEELLSSLEEPDDEVAAAWATELERRSREVAEGRVQPTSWPTARTEILKELEQRRASRTAS